MKRLLLLLLAGTGALFARGDSLGINDGIDRTDPNFVTVSLLVMGPGDSLYSCGGHACFRLECPKFNLDYCFSYESESAENRVAQFLAGKLKMGMFAVPTSDFLKTYAEEGRGIMAYPLDLPPDAKQRLWKLLDEKAGEGIELQYDFVKRGCAQSALQYLFEAIRPYPIAYPPWPKHYDLTKRELFAEALEKYRWNMFIINFLVGTDAEENVPKLQRVIVPVDLRDFLRTTTINGRPILSGEGIELLAMKKEVKPAVISPVVAALIVLALLLVGIWRWPRGVGLAMTVVQALAGAILIYLVGFSNLPATTWNWLIIPFNPLPLVFWKWRRYWAWPFAGVIAIWLACMILAPHRMTDPAYYILALAYIALYVRVGVRK